MNKGYCFVVWWTIKMRQTVKNKIFTTKVISKQMVNGKTIFCKIFSSLSFELCFKRALSRCQGDFVPILSTQTKWFKLQWRHLMSFFPLPTTLLFILYYFIYLQKRKWLPAEYFFKSNFFCYCCGSIDNNTTILLYYRIV